MGWKTRTLEAYGFSFALIAALVDSVPLGFTSSSPTLASAFLSFLKAKALPQGWIMMNPNSSASLELGVVTSLTLALLVSYPVVAYAGIRLISKNRLSRRTRVALVAGAIALSCRSSLRPLLCALCRDCLHIQWSRNGTCHLRLRFLRVHSERHCRLGFGPLRSGLSRCFGQVQGCSLARTQRGAMSRYAWRGQCQTS